MHVMDCLTGIYTFYRFVRDFYLDHLWIEGLSRFKDNIGLR